MYTWSNSIGCKFARTMTKSVPELLLAFTIAEPVLTVAVARLVLCCKDASVVFLTNICVDQALNTNTHINYRLCTGGDFS